MHCYRFTVSIAAALIYPIMSTSINLLLLLQVGLPLSSLSPLLNCHIFIPIKAHWCLQFLMIKICNILFPCRSFPTGIYRMRLDQNLPCPSVQWRFAIMCVVPLFWLISIPESPEINTMNDWSGYPPLNAADQQNVGKHAAAAGDEEKKPPKRSGANQQLARSHPGIQAAGRTQNQRSFGPIIHSCCVVPSATRKILASFGEQPQERRR